MAAYTAVDDARLFFNPLLHTGNGSELVVSGVGFSPDLTWIKNRTNVDFHVLTDTVRGATNYLKSNDTTAETTNSEGLKSWQSDGYTLGTQNQVNEVSANFVGWNWKAGTTAVPSGGTITPSACSFSATSGFGIYKYTGNGVSGATIAHGLGEVPTMMFVKRTDAGTLNWMNYNPYVGNDRALFLNLTNAPDVSGTYWNSVTPTSTLFTLGNAVGTNNSTDIYVAYVWTDIKGYSKFGQYTGNGNADGQFVYTGFKPAFVMVKKSAVAGTNWYMFDNKRGGYNGADYWLYANTTNSENAGGGNIDLLSNGFKFRSSEGDINANGVTYIYMTFADNPLVNSESVPGTSRL